MRSEGVEDQRRHTAVTSQTGCLKHRLKAWSESRKARGIALIAEDCYHVGTGGGSGRERKITLQEILQMLLE